MKFQKTERSHFVVYIENYFAVACGMLKQESTELIMANNLKNNTSKLNGVSPDVLVAAQQLGQRLNISELARHMGKSPTILANKLNPDCDTHHLTLGEAVAITELSGDNGILESLAHLRGKMLVDVPAGAVNDEDLADQVMLAQAVFGKMMQVIHDARKDGVIDCIEQSDIERVGTEAAQMVIGLIKSTGANVRQLAPAKATAST